MTFWSYMLWLCLSAVLGYPMSMALVYLFIWRPEIRRERRRIVGTDWRQRAHSEWANEFARAERETQ